MIFGLVVRKGENQNRANVHLTGFKRSHDTVVNLLYSPSKCQGIRQVGKKGSPCGNQHNNNGGVRLALFYFDYIRFLFCLVLMHEGCKMEKL